MSQKKVIVISLAVAVAAIIALNFASKKNATVAKVTGAA